MQSHHLRLAVSLSLAAALTLALAQLPGLPRPKIPGLSVPGIPGLDRLIKEEPPITTALSDAVYEVAFLDDFQPRDVARLTVMPRQENGAFKAFPGCFTYEAQSYCLHAGTHGPGKGEGYLFAPLKGPRESIIRGILQRSVAQPQIPQPDVQLLIWSILARTKPSQLAANVKQTAGKLLTPQEMSSLEGSGWDYLKEQASSGPSIFGSLPGPVRQIMEAENKMRNMLYQANAPFAELESVAVLSGEYKPQRGDREVPRGRWSFHPEGYFVRYYPHGYSHTTQYVYFPEAIAVQSDDKGAVTAITDPSGRSLTVEAGEMVYREKGKELGRQKLALSKSESDRRKGDFEKLLTRLKADKNEAKRLAAIADVAAAWGEPSELWAQDACDFAFGAWMSSFAASVRAPESLWAYLGSIFNAERGYDPSGTVATPGQTGRQRLAQSARCRHAETPAGGEYGEFQKAVVDAMRAKGYTVGPEHVFVYDQRDQGNLLRFVVRMGHNNNPLPTKDCIDELIGHGAVPPGSLEGAKELMFGSVQTAGSMNRVGVRSVDVETGVITGAGKGDGTSLGTATGNAFGNYQRW